MAQDGSFLRFKFDAKSLSKKGPWDLLHLPRVHLLNTTSTTEVSTTSTTKVATSTVMENLPLTAAPTTTSPATLLLPEKTMAQDGNLQKWHQNSPRTNWRAFCSAFMVRTMMVHDGNLHRWHKRDPEQIGGHSVLCLWTKK